MRQARSKYQEDDDDEEEDDDDDDEEAAYGEAAYADQVIPAATLRTCRARSAQPQRSLYLRGWKPLTPGDVIRGHVLCQIKGCQNKIIAERN